MFTARKEGALRKYSVIIVIAVLAVWMMRLISRVHFKERRAMMRFEKGAKPREV